MPMILFVGQAPSRRTDGQEAFTGASGQKIAQMIGMTHNQFLQFRNFARINLLERYQGASGGPSGKGDAFPLALAQTRVRAIVGLSADFVFVGMKVAKICLKASGYSLGDPEPLESGVMPGGQRYFVLPHPSGINQWYNNALNKNAAQVRLRTFLGMEDPCTTRPIA